MKNIIAIVGMCGAGKSIACDFFEKLGYQKVYFGNVTMEKLKEENLEINPENEKMMREKLRTELGMGAYAVVLLDKIKNLSKDHNVVLDGLYSWDELKILKAEFKDSLTSIAIVTDRHLRYERLSIREVRPLNNKEANDRDIAEIENIAKAGPIAYADYFIENNGTISDFHKKLENILTYLK